MSKYRELLAQRESLNAKIEQALLKEKGDAIDAIRQKMADYGITLAELAPAKSKKGQRKSKA
jgi:DNA-binding protein H-NS